MLLAHREILIKGSRGMDFLRRTIVRKVVAAADRGNPLARALVRRETRKVYDALPAQSNIVRDDLLIPDLTRPLPAAQQGGPMGDHELVPLDKHPVRAEHLVGREVHGIATMLGSYGMGSYGFLGVDLGEAWLILPIYNAAEWVCLDGRILQDLRKDAAQPWIVNGDDSALLERVCGGRVTSVRLAAKSFALTLDNGAVLEITEDPAKRPGQRGNGKPRVLLPYEDLSQEVFLSPTPEIYI